MEQSSSLRLFGRVFLVAILVLVAVWILRPLLPALAWAGVLALATWPAREWLIRKGMTTSRRDFTHATCRYSDRRSAPRSSHRDGARSRRRCPNGARAQGNRIGHASLGAAGSFPGRLCRIMVAGSPGGSGCGQGAFGASRIPRLYSLDAKPRQRSGQPFSDPGVYAADAFLRVSG